MAYKPGKVRHNAFDNRVYWKPTLKRLVVRSTGVNRTSGAVVKRNKIFAEKAPQMVLACRGQSWDKYIACMKNKAKELGLGTGASKSPEYRKRFWKHPATATVPA